MVPYASSQLQTTTAGMACRSLVGRPAKAGKDFHSLSSFMSADHASFYSPFIRKSWFENSDHG